MRLVISLLILMNIGCSSYVKSEGFGVRSPARNSKLLRIATNSEISTLDPHYQFLDTNLNIAFQIFEALTYFGPNKELRPALAEKWELTEDAKVWKFFLKKNVRFHGGSFFDKKDVLASLERVRHYASDKQSGYISNISKINWEKTKQLNEEEKDLSLLLIATQEYSRFLPHDLASVVILNRNDANAARDLGQSQNAAAVLKEFAQGKWLNGTGPYRFQKWIPLKNGQPAGEARVVLLRHNGDSRVEFDEVHYLPILNPQERIDALKNNRADIVVALPGQTDGVKVLRAPGLRVIHLQLFQGHDDRETRIPTPPAASLHVPVKDQTGNSLPNPLVSRNFRKALALALDKQKLIEVVEGQGKPTEQYMQVGQVGFLTGIPEKRFDLVAAREFLLKASEEAGFEFLANRELFFTINGPEGRYFKDKEVLQAVAQMWTGALTFQSGKKKFSIRFDTKTEPMAIFSNNARWYLVNLLGGGVDNGQGEAVLRLYLTPQSALNYTSYNNALINQLYAEGSKSVDPEKGNDFFTKALRMALIEEQAMIPLFNTIESWGVRPGICFEPRKDGLTQAKHIVAKDQCDQ